MKFDVVIRYRRRCFPIARVRDISPEGVYVHADKLTLPAGTQVEIEMERWGREWRISAIVIHQGVEGVGLLFQICLPELYELETAPRGPRSPCPLASVQEEIGVAT